MLCIITIQSRISITEDTQARNISSGPEKGRGQALSLCHLQPQLTTTLSLLHNVGYIELVSYHISREILVLLNNTKPKQGALKSYIFRKKSLHLTPRRDLAEKTASVDQSIESIMAKMMALVSEMSNFGFTNWVWNQN